MVKQIKFDFEDDVDIQAIMNFVKDVGFYYRI